MPAQPSRTLLGQAILGAGILLAATLGLGASRAQAGPAYVPHELLVGYRPGPMLAATADLEMRLGGHAHSSAAAPHSVLLRLPRRESVAAAARRLRHEPGVAFAEPNFIAHAAGGFFPDDPGRSGVAGGWQRMQWNMPAGAGIDAPDAWAHLIADHRPGGRGVVVAILDSGVAYRRWKAFRRSPDFLHTRFVAPRDFVAGNHFPLDRDGHGTFVTGVVAESTNNNFGLTGLAYGAKIMPVRVLDASGLGDENTIARGIRYAVRHHAQVINLSLEFLPDEVNRPSEIPAIINAISYAHRHGVIVVGASGNDQGNRLAYPARARDVISVGATTADRCMADYSNGGSGLDLVAPGGGTDAILPNDSDCHPDRILPSIYQMTLVNPPQWGRFGYPNYYIGTSMAAPAVAAACAMVIASGVVGRHPTPSQVMARLEQTAQPLGTGRPNDEYGYGLLDVGAATAPGGPA